MIVVLRGSVLVNDTEILQDAQFAVLERSGTQVKLEATSSASVLLLGGEPINEPIVGHRPFVMNTRAEIAQAIEDFNNGRFGRQPS